MDDALTEQNEHAIITSMRELLAPAIGADRAEQIVGWIRSEIQARPLIGYCWDGKIAEAWELLKESPISPGRTVFAMLHWESSNAVVAYCFKRDEVPGGGAVSFYREVIFHPQHVTGPVSHNALFEDLRSFLLGSELAGYVDHLRDRLDPKTFDRVVQASKDFPGVDIEDPESHAVNGAS